MAWKMPGRWWEVWTVTISGFELAYRNQDEVMVKVSLRGRIPPTSAPGSTKNLVTIQELDARGYTINSKQ